MTLKRILILSYTIIIGVFVATSGLLLYLNFTFDKEYQTLTETVVLEVRLKNLTEDIHTHIKRLSGYYSDERRNKLDRDLESYERIIESLDARVSYDESLRIYDQVTALSNNYLELIENAADGIEEGKKEASSSLIKSIDKIAPSLETMIVQLIGEEVEYLHKRQGRLNIMSLDSIRIGIVIYGVGIIISVLMAGHFFNRITGFINRFNKEMHAIASDHEPRFRKSDERSEFGFLVEEYKALQDRILIMKNQKQSMDRVVNEVSSIKEEIKEPVKNNMMAISTLLDMTESTLEDYQTGSMAHLPLENYLKDMIWGLELMMVNEVKENDLLESVNRNNQEDYLLSLFEFYEQYFNERQLEFCKVIKSCDQDLKISLSKEDFSLWNDGVLLHGLSKGKRVRKVVYELKEDALVIKFTGIKGQLDEDLISKSLLKYSPWLSVFVSDKTVTVYI